MSEPWMHIGRVWTNGEPLLAMDSGLVDAWDSDERFDKLADLGTEATRIVLHVSGQPYDHALKDALAYPTDADAHGGTLRLPGGELALFSSALDEVRDNSVPLVRASPGPTPRAYRPASMSTPVPRWSRDCW